MADTESSTNLAHERPAMSETAQLEQDRQQIASDAVLEIEALTNILLERADKGERDAEQAIRTEYVIRGLAIRINELSKIVMGAMGMSDEKSLAISDLNNLSGRLYGARH